MKQFTAPDGLTIAELKRLLAQYPDTDEHGDPTEVWISTRSGLSSPVVCADPLNKRESGALVWADLLLMSRDGVF